MSMININELFSGQEEKEKHKEEIYDSVLQKCHQRIIRSTKLNPYINYCFYIVPKFVYGIPLYNIEKCINYLVTHLTKNGFNVTYTHPNFLLISWEKKREEKKEKLSIFPNNNSNIKSVTDYKPSGNLIYNNNILKDINKKKNYLLN